MKFSDLSEKKQDSEEIYSGRLLHVFRDTVELPNGKNTTREYIRHVGAVCVVAITDDGNVIVERQFRYPFGREILEIPAGKLNGKDEDPAKAAARELLEETGAVAGELVSLGEFYPTPAYSDEVIHMFAARKLTFGDDCLDDDEFLNVGLMPLDELVSEIMCGNVPDGKTQAAVLRAFRLFGSGRKK